jgi:hypothetical protein
MALILPRKLSKQLLPIKVQPRPLLAWPALWLVFTASLSLGALLIALSPRPAISAERIVINIKNLQASCEVVSRPADLYRGLSGRTKLAPHHGMLFNFADSAPRDFVMRDMNFPLDIIFLDQGRIIKIAQNLEPEGHQPQRIYDSGGPANQVLEVAAGTSAAYGLRIGDPVYLNP